MRKSIRKNPKSFCQVGNSVIGFSEAMLPERFGKRFKNLLMVAAACCFSASGVFADDLFEERQWTVKGGPIFSGIFLKKDFATGGYFFSKPGEKIFMVGADDVALIEAVLKEREKAAMPPPPITAGKPLVFATPALVERQWANKEGRKINGSLVEVSRERVILQTGGKKVSIPLDNLAQDDRTAAQLWTAATNDALGIPEATFHYRLAREKKVVTRFSIELSGTFSRILIAEAAIDVNGKNHPFETRFTTDHSNGTFQSEQRKKGGEWGVTLIGKWDDRYLAGGDVSARSKEEYGALMGKFADGEIASIGPWLAREIQVGDNPPWPLTSSSIAYIRLPGSNLPAALRFAVSAPPVVDVDKRAASEFNTEVFPFTWENGGSLFHMESLLEMLRVHDLILVQASCKVSGGNESAPPSPGRGSGIYTLTLEKVTLTSADTSEFKIDSQAATMDGGTLKALFKRRQPSK